MNHRGIAVTGEDSEEEEDDVPLPLSIAATSNSSVSHASNASSVGGVSSSGEVEEEEQQQEEKQEADENSEQLAVAQNSEPSRSAASIPIITHMNSNPLLNSRSSGTFAPIGGMTISGEDDEEDDDNDVHEKARARARAKEDGDGQEQQDGAVVAGGEGGAKEEINLQSRESCHHAVHSTKGAMVGDDPEIGAQQRQLERQRLDHPMMDFESNFSISNNGQNSSSNHHNSVSNDGDSSMADDQEVDAEDAEANDDGVLQPDNDGDERRQTKQQQPPQQQQSTQQQQPQQQQQEGKKSKSRFSSFVQSSKNALMKVKGKPKAVLGPEEASAKREKAVYAKLEKIATGNVVEFGKKAEKDFKQLDATLVSVTGFMNEIGLHFRSAQADLHRALAFQ
eukprot:ANDGO_03200.mRNA.1 hypothetical protein